MIGVLGMWDAGMQTLALMIMAAGLSVLIGIPLGVLMARVNWLRSVMLPVLDVMQTMPSFVYLIPVVMLFGLGKIPAIIATVIYAVPPLIRLTDLGIRLVDREVLEASRAFGANPRQQLFGVQLPLALPNIMAGINQTTMMALSMVVIASMIGARGLGYEVLLGINRLEVGRGLLAGLGIVVLAVLFDRITQSMDSACARRPAMSKIEVKSIYKVFGPHPAKWLQAAQGGMSKEELLAKSGHTLGLRDISLSIDEGSIYVIMGLSGSG